MKKITLLLALVLVFAGCGEQTPKVPASPADGVPANTVGIANPASTNCADKGGSVQIKKLPSGGEYGVCLFEDNRQCEEWALMNGKCPVGGIKITGYDTDAQIYCAISGGDVNMDEGTCTIGGDVCDTDTYYNKGECKKVDFGAEAKKQCGSGVSMVYMCGDYFGVVADNMGGGTTIYTKDGMQYSCPVVAPNAMSDDCKKYMMGSNCAQVNICDVKCTSADKENKICTKEYMPVCGDDNKEYGNKCEACASGEIDNYTSGKCAGSEGDVMVGNDKDEHGCIGSAGYTWCESKNECIRSWETTCEGSMTAQAVFDKFAADYQVDLAAATDVTMEWRDADNNISKIAAKQVSMGKIAQSPDVFGDFFKKQGFTESLPQAADGVSESQAGYLNGDMGCLVHYILVSDVYAVESATITCGNVK